MSTTSEFAAWCEDHIGRLTQQLEALESGRLTTRFKGKTESGAWIDSTADTLNDTKRNLDELKELVASYRGHIPMSFKKFALNHEPNGFAEKDFIIDLKSDDDFPDVRSWEDVFVYLESIDAVPGAFEGASGIWEAYSGDVVEDAFTY